MRTLTCLLALFILTNNTQAQTQSVIYDATTIMNATRGENMLLIPNAVDFDSVDPIRGIALPVGFTVTDKSKKIIIDILKRNAGLPDIASGQDVLNAYALNPFLKSLAAELAANHFSKSMGAIDMSTIGNFSTSNLSGSLGSNLLGNIANGTADFLIKRAQEEISVSVFEKLKEFLNRYPEFDTLFPRTCALIKPIQPYEYNKALEAFKAAIREDLQNFIPRIALLYDIPRYAVLNKRVPSLTLVFAASALIGELHEQPGFAETIYKMGERPFLSEQNNYAGLLKVLTILSNSLLDKSLADPEDKRPQYINSEFIGSVTHGDPTLFADLSNLYFGLIWQHTNTISFTVGTDSKTFGQLLEHLAGNTTVSTALQTVNTILNSIIIANKELATLKEDEFQDSRVTGKADIRVQRFTIYANLISNLLSLSDIYIAPTQPVFNIRIKEIRQYLPRFTTDIMTMIKDFQQEEYNLGISKFADLLRTTSDYLDTMKNNRDLVDDFGNRLAAQKGSFEEERTALNARIAALPIAVTGTTTADILINTNIEAERQELLVAKEKLTEKINQINDQEKNKKTIVFKLSKVIEYVDLLAAVTKAENSAAVESLLESHALPAGSSRIKKVTSFNIAVQAYVGGFFGRSNNQGDGFTNTYGLTAPIGFTFSTGFTKAGSLSLLAGIFDIGGIIRYKLDNQGKYEQDISLAGLVSPSLHAVYGFPWYLPLSAGLGCQWVSPTTTTSNKINLKPSFNAFIGVDIPLFNLKVIKKRK